MNNLIYEIGLAVLILTVWLVYKHGLWVTVFCLGTVSALFMILVVIAHFISKPAKEESKQCVDACQLVYEQCGQECYAENNGYQVKTCFDNCSQVLAECFSICKKEKPIM